MPKTITLQEGEIVIAVVPEYASGPGWANQPTWVYVRDSQGKCRMVCIQPDERSASLNALFHAGEAMTRCLINAVPVKRAKRKE